MVALPSFKTIRVMGSIQKKAPVCQQEPSKFNPFNHKTVIQYASKDLLVQERELKEAKENKFKRRSYFKTPTPR
jgi:hypothetical protein